MLILALMSQLVAALLTSLLAVRALRGLTDRLLGAIPPAGAAQARRWLTGALIAIGVTSGIHVGAGLGAGAFGAWPLSGEGTFVPDVSLLILAAAQAMGAVAGALRGLAFAVLFLLGLALLSGAFNPAQERPAILGRGGSDRRPEPRREQAGRGREMPRGPRPGRMDDPRSSSGEPRRMPGGGGRGRGPIPDRERPIPDRDRDRREGRESFREGPALAAHGPAGGPATRYGARPIPDQVPGAQSASANSLRGSGERFQRPSAPPMSAMRGGRGGSSGERRGLGTNEPAPGGRERMGVGDRPLENEPGM